MVKLADQKDADAAVISCVDPRLRLDLMANTLRNTFGISRPVYQTAMGGVKGLVAASVSGEGGGLVGFVEFAVRVIGTSHIVLLNHENCRAYGLDHRYGAEEEKRFHIEELRRAEEFLRKHVPCCAEGSVTISLGMVRFKDAGLFIMPIKHPAVYQRIYPVSDSGRMVAVSP